MTANAKETKERVLSYSSFAVCASTILMPVGHAAGLMGISTAAALSAFTAATGVYGVLSALDMRSRDVNGRLGVAFRKNMLFKTGLAVVAGATFHFALASADPRTEPVKPAPKTDAVEHTTKACVPAPVLKAQ